MKRNKVKSGLVLGIFLMTIACSHSPSEIEANSQEPEQLLQITQAEFDYNKMHIGQLSNQNFEERLNCNGYIKAQPNGLAQISSRISGIVESIQCSTGDYVKKGQVLCLITSNDLILMQQNFVETSARLKQVTADYERIKILYEDKISAKKDFLAAESEYKAMTANYKSLKLQLENLSLNTAKIEEGELYSEFPVSATINGYITEHNLVLGQFVEQQKSLVEIVNVEKLQLHLSVYESDFNQLKPGQEVQFNLLGENSSSHTAMLSSIGKTINMESKSIECLAKINYEKEFNFINQAYIEASIIIDSKEKQALPNEAIIKSDNDHYVFVLEKTEDSVFYLKKHQVILGKSNSQHTEIVNSKDLKNVLVSGVYNLNVE